MAGSARAAVQSAALEAAAALEEIERADLADGLELRRAGTVFARFDGDGASFRIGRPVVVAATRTPGAGASDLGADWVLFLPDTAERFDLDRARAWLEVAWRRAGDGT